ncbi:MAG: hypothetical protein ACRDRG_16820 [Pseudonocardiaceae bacterium]
MRNELQPDISGHPLRDLTPKNLPVSEFDLRGRYAEVANVCREQKFTTERPFPITIVAARLLDGLRQ